MALETLLTDSESPDVTHAAHADSEVKNGNEADEDGTAFLRAPLLSTTKAPEALPGAGK